MTGAQGTFKAIGGGSGSNNDVELIWKIPFCRKRCFLGNIKINSVWMLSLIKVGGFPPYWKCKNTLFRIFFVL